MDWIAVGALAELVGAVAVVLTLVAFIFTINHQTK